MKRVALSLAPFFAKGAVRRTLAKWPVLSPVFALMMFALMLGLVVVSTVMLILATAMVGNALTGEAAASLGQMF